MFPISTTMAGECMAFPDVCLTPAPPAPPIPTPYPNIAMLMQAEPPTCSMFVKILNMPVCSETTMVEMTQGDEAGVNGGVASGMIMGPAQFSMGSMVVTVEGKGVVHLTSPSRHNGISANAPEGVQTVPSQTVVTTAE